MIKRNYGWINSLPDHRDAAFRYRASKDTLNNLPPLVDLRPLDIPICDQQATSACTGMGWAGIVGFECKKQGIDLIPSPLFIYWNERDIENSTNTDGGASPRDGAKAISSIGVCPESEWVFNEDNVLVKPPDNCFKDALLHLAIQYNSIKQDINQLKSCLAEGYPFAVGITVYDGLESDESAKTGIVNLPTAKENNLGGHFVVCVGYDDSKQVWIMRNSWGTGWGISGYFTLPYSYLTNPDLADDFWKVTLMK